jgi:hypothetical protein
LTRNEENHDVRVMSHQTEIWTRGLPYRKLKCYSRHRTVQSSQKVKEIS